MSLRTHTIANLAGNILPMAVLIFTVPLYLKLIGAERYGVLAVIWALIGYFGVFDLGLSRAVTHRMARIKTGCDAERSNLLWTALVATFFLGLMGGLVLWLCADLLFTRFVSVSDVGRSEIAGSVGWIALMLPILLPTSVMLGALQGRQRFVEVSANNILGSVISQVLPLSVALAGHSTLDTLVPAALVAKLISFALFFLQCFRYVPLRGYPVIDLVHLRPLISYGGWVSIMSLLSLLMVAIDRVIIAALSGAKAVAYYSVPYNIISKLTIIPGSLATALFPRFAGIEESEGKGLEERAVSNLIAIMTPIVILGLALSQPLLMLWVGAEFSEKCRGVAELLLIGIWINSLAFPLHSRLLAASDPRKIVVIYLIEVPMYFTMLWLGLTYWGVAGAAAAWSFRVLVDTLLLAHLAHAIKFMFIPAARGLALVLAALCVVTFAGPNSALRWLLCMLFFAISIIVEREQLVEMVNSAINRKKVLST